nr:hypothetical protein [Tanacetum cinerariifolium]
MVDVRRLSAHVIKLRDMPEGVLVLYGLSRVSKSRVCDPVLRVMGIHDFLCLSEWTSFDVQEEPYLYDLAVGTPISKILATAEASKKRKASVFCATSSHIGKHTRCVLGQSSGSTTHPSLFVGITTKTMRKLVFDDQEEYYERE